MSYLLSFHKKQRNINLRLYGRDFQYYTGLQIFSEASLVLQRLLRLQCPATYQSSLRQFYCRYRLRQFHFLTFSPNNHYQK
jgi:hypothetical protein